jgi:flagellar biogenesis protein FliO
MQGKAEILEWESRWAMPVAAATLVAVAFLVASVFAGGSVSGDGEAEILRSTHEHSSAVTVTSLLQALGFALFALPLYYLFRAAQGRSDRVRRQFVGLIVVAPLFLAISSGLSAAARNDAASAFVAGDAKPTLTRSEAKKDCAEERDDLGEEDFAAEFDPKAGQSPLAACEDRQLEDDAATEARSEASTAAAVSGFGIAGALGLAVALFYVGLWSMRTGLLGRFWASLGMALGVAIVFGLFPLALVWFLYLALLIGGWVPGGRPPAWEAGEAIPWPTPGEKAAEELEPAEDESSADQALGEERRKRKQRD